MSEHTGHGSRLGRAFAGLADSLPGERGDALVAAAVATKAAVLGRPLKQAASEPASRQPADHTGRAAPVSPGVHAEASLSTRRTPATAAVCEQIRGLLETPEIYWPDDSYFHRRNREKLARATTLLRKEHQGSVSDLPEEILRIVEGRQAAGIGTIFVMSNGGAGCHHLGLLLSELPGFRMTDEVYHPVELLEWAESADRSSAGAVIEALNVLHLGTTGPAARRDWVVNIGHLRPEAKPARLRRILPDARFVLLVRSPYRVATSRAFRKPEYRSASGAGDVDDLEYLRRQSSYTANHFRRAAAERWDAIIRYEDLVRDPVTAVGDMLKMLGLSTDPAALRTAARQRAVGSGVDRGPADNLNLAPRAMLSETEASILADDLVDVAHHWGYEPPAEVSDHLDAIVVACGAGRGAARPLWTPFFSDIHQNRAAYDLLLAGEVKVFRNLPVTRLPTGDDRWNADPLGNVSWRLFYHSLGWLLARSWAIDNDIDVEENLAEIEQVVLSHIAATVESSDGDAWAWDDHATGDRLAVIAYLFHHHLAGRLDRVARDRVIAAMEVHVERIAEFRHREKWLDSNHGVFHAMGAINVGILLPDHPLGRRASDVGLEYLRAVLGRLVHLEDGVSVEQSVSYHSINLLLIRKVQEALRANELDVGIDLAALCGTMVAFNHALRGVSNLPCIGDTPFGYEVPKAALETEDGEVMAEEARYAVSGGLEGTPFAEPLLYDEAGLVVLRRGEPTMAGICARAVFTLHAERNHHGHVDQLSITYQLDDHDVLVDSGGPYAYGDPLRFSYFVAARAHNVVLIDDEDHTSGARRLGAGSSDAVQWAVGERTGTTGQRIRRATALVDGETLLVFDTIDAKDRPGRRRFTTLWHLDPSADPIIERTDGQGVEISLPHRARPLRLAMAVEGAVCRVERGVERAPDQAPQGWITRELGSIEPAPVVVVETETESHQATTWVAPPEVLVNASASGRATVTTRSGAAYELEYSGGHDLVVRAL